MYSISPSKGIDPKDKHIAILEERLLYAIRRREYMIAQTPDITPADLWKIDIDIKIKKEDLQKALEYQRGERTDDDDDEII